MVGSLIALMSPEWVVWRNVSWYTTSMTNYNAEWRKRNPVKVAAHTILAHAVRSGKIQPQPCLRCGMPKAHGHHTDYSKPLDVTWLCSKCHKREHRKPNPKREMAQALQRGRKHRLAGNRVKARFLRTKGLSYAQIAIELGTSKGTAFKWVNRPAYK